MLYYESNKEHNSKGSFADGYKLSYIPLQDEIESEENLTQLLIGCDDDDTFYKKSDTGRLKVYVQINRAMTAFDLEDFLKKVKEFCPQLF